MPSTVAGIQLDEGEEVLFDTRPSWLAWPISFWTAILFSWLVAPLILLWIPWRGRRRLRYIVTTDRVVKREGRRSKSTREIRTDNIRQIETNSPWIGGKFGKGDITVTTHDGAEVSFDAMPKHQTVANAIREHQRSPTAA